MLFELLVEQFRDHVAGSVEFLDDKNRQYRTGIHFHERIIPGIIGQDQNLVGTFDIGAGKRLFLGKIPIHVHDALKLPV